MGDDRSEPALKKTQNRLVRSALASIRAKVTLAVVLPLIMLLGVFTAIEYSRHRQGAIASMSTLAAYSGRVIEVDTRLAMLQSNFDEVQALLNAIGSDTDQFRAVYLLDTSGKVRFSPNGVNVGLQLDNSEPDCQPCHRLPADQRPASVIVTDSSGQRVFRSMYVIENGPECAPCHRAEDRLRGLLLTDMSVAPLEASMTADLHKNLLWGSITVLITVIILNLVVNRTVIQRVEQLTAALRRFGQGRKLTALSSNEPDEVGELARAFDVMAQRVVTHEAENQALSTNLRKQNTRQGELLKRLNTAQEDERKRVAREIHDELSPALIGLALRAETMGEYLPPEAQKARDFLEQIRDLTRDTTRRMYRLIMDLRPTALDDLGLAAALRAHAERLLATEHIDFEMDASRLTKRLPSHLETTAYRVFQEALNNVVRHSGAQHVLMTLRQQNEHFEGELVDDGQGFDFDDVALDGTSPRGLGILGMQERVSQVGGYLEIDTRVGSGTRILFSIPLGEVADE